MPAYPWLFEWKGEVGKGDRVVSVPDQFARDGHLVAKEEALQLVAYLQSLTQVPLLGLARLELFRWFDRPTKQAA